MKDNKIVQPNPLLLPIILVLVIAGIWYIFHQFNAVDKTPSLPQEIRK